MKASVHVLGSAGVLLSLSMAAGGAARLSSPKSASEKPQGGAVVVLDTKSFWRCHFTWQTIQVRRESGELELVSVQWGSHGPAKVAKAARTDRSPLPPADWTQPEFDDHAWARARGPMFTRRTRRLALLCARGKFQVSDPAKVGRLHLALAYRGGAAVYLNGSQVARGHLPKGKIHLLAPAEDYPNEAYLAPDGFLLRHAFREPEKYADRYALRGRRLKAEIPASLLRKGTNVLAIELHRSPISEVFYRSGFRDSRQYYLWDMIGLEEVRLTAPAGKGLVPNVARPRGVQIWNRDVFVSVHNVDHGEPTEALRPIEIAAARNGPFSGQVVMSSAGAIRGLAAETTDLRGPGGAVIPAAAVQVRFGVLGDHAASRNEPHRWRTPIPFERVRRRFDGLIRHAPAEVAVDAKAGGAVQPVWITVRVPKDAAAGEYAGKLTLRAAGAKSVEVPLKLHVADWALPDPKQFRSHIGLIQSPESLALHYNVPMWSPAHWRLIDRSFALLGQVGTKVVYLPLLRRTYFGNEHSMVRWTSESGGSYRHDFSLVEKYLDVAIKHLGKVPVVCCYCWDVNTGSKYFGTKKFRDAAGLTFTAADPATGKLVDAQGPKWGEPAARAFWKPVFAALRKILAERGLAKSMMVGVAGDRRPTKAAVEDLRSAAPQAPWVISSHSSPDNLFGQPVGYRSDVWGLMPAPDPAEARYYGWKNPDRIVAFPRYGSSVIGHSIRTWTALGAYRIAVEAALTARGRGAGLHGIGRCGADFWNVIEGPRGRRPVLGRYAETSHWHGGWLRNSTPYVLAPGRDGPVATVRFEMLREGIQEGEARIFLEEALTDPAARARLGEPLARRCQEILDERVRVIRRAIDGGGTYLTWTWLAGSGVLERSRKLYAAAAEVAARLSSTLRPRPEGSSPKSAALKAGVGRRPAAKSQPSTRPLPRGNPPAAADPRWPQIREGHHVRWAGRTWNTRKRSRLWEDGGVARLGQRNGTATYLGEDRINAGTVEFDVKFDAGILAVGGGGKHFMEIMSWVADRSDRRAIQANPWSRIEVVNLADRPRCIVWNYGSHFRGQAAKIFPIGPAFQPDRWVHIRFEWAYRAPAGRITIRVDRQSYTSEYRFVPGTIGPGRYYLFGHVETRQPDGCLHFRNFQVR